MIEAPDGLGKGYALATLHGCPPNEIEAMAQRLEVAVLLRSGVTYQEIARRTGASSATISRVNRALLYGADGYSRILDAMGVPAEADE